MDPEHNLKRKSKEVNSSDNEEHNEEPQKSKRPFKINNKRQPFLGNSIRKRKLPCDNSTSPKKKLKFFYLNEKLTKPRKKKVSTENEENSVDKSKDEISNDNEEQSFENTPETLLECEDYCNSDLFFIDEKKENYESFKQKDLGFYIFDEIALEGLDGITLEALWKRLKGVFPVTFNQQISNLIWSMIKSNKYVKFYELPIERGKLKSFNRFTYIDDGIFIEPPTELVEIYPFQPINEKNNRGSCSTFTTRKLLDKNINLNEAETKYGPNKFVLVADQCVRNKSLINETADPNTQLMETEYMVLEKIGRARYHGEITHGKFSLQLFCSDSKSLHYIRKNLMKNFLIISQNFSLYSSQKLNLIGAVVHLPRFYSKRKNKNMVIMEQIASVLREKPNYEMEFRQIGLIFGRSRSVKKISKHKLFHRFFKIENKMYRSIYPNAPKSEWKLKNSNNERKIRMIKLIDPYKNICANFDKDEEQINVKEKNNEKSYKIKLFDCLRNSYLFLHSKGQEGATIQEVFDHMGTDFYSVRMAIKKLMNNNVLRTQKVNQGRQITQRYYVKYIDESVYTHFDWQLGENVLKKVLQAYEDVSTENKVSPLVENILNEPVETDKLLQLKIPNNNCIYYLKKNIESTEIAHLQNSNLSEQPFDINYHFTLEKFEPKLLQILSTNLKSSVKLRNLIQSQLNNLNNLSFQINRMPKWPIKKNFYSNKRYDDEICKIYFLSVLHQSNIADDDDKQDVMRLLKAYFEIMLETKGIKRKPKVDKTQEISKKSETSIEDVKLLDKYLINPVIVFSEIIDNVKVQILESTESNTITIKDKDVSGAYLRRESKILDHLQDHKIEEIFKLYRLLKDCETKDGITTTISRKSLDAILIRLASEKIVKFYKVLLTGNNIIRKKMFVCLPMVDENNEVIKHSIEETKLKCFFDNDKITKALSVSASSSSSSPFLSNDIKNSITEYKELGDSNKKVLVKTETDQSYAKKLGYKTKFGRMRVLHEFLFYLNSLNNETVSKLQKDDVFNVFDSMGVKVNENDIDNMPPIYCNEISWKMFISPLPIHQGWPKGWILICDLLLRLPLSVFVKLVCITYNVPELNSYLEHPVKRHYLIKYLPLEIRSFLLYRRKYLYYITEIINNLCYIGVTQFGPQKFKDKAQVFIYLNTQTSLFNTTTSGPGFNKIEDKKYEKIKFYFNNYFDVENYWNEMWRICMNTPLGKKHIIEDKNILIEDTTKSLLQLSIKSKTPETVEAYDNGIIPGDHRGPAGLDSSLWAHVRKNWIIGGRQQKILNPSSLKSEKFEILSKPIQYDELINSRKDTKIFLKPKVNNKNKKLDGKGKNKIKKIKKNLVKTKQFKKYYDKVDLIIMKRNKQTRVEWDDNEDRLLCLIHVAITFLTTAETKRYIYFKTIRDFMHTVYPKSKNKTSNSIRRRISTLLAYKVNAKIMEKNVDNLLNSQIISKYFNKFSHKANYPKIDLNIAFLYLMNYINKNKSEIELLLLGRKTILDYFSDQYIKFFEVLLDKVNYKKPLYENPENDIDLQKNNIKSILHCSLNCKKEDSVWIDHLFNLYKKYSDLLVTQCVNELKEGTLLTSCKKNKTNDGLLHIPFKFSKLYELMFYSNYKEKFFQDIWQSFPNFNQHQKKNIKNNSFTCSELYSFYNNIIYKFQFPEMSIILNPNFSDHTEVIEELSKRFYLYLNKIKNNQIVEKETEQPIEQLDETETKNIVMNLIFRIPYLIEGNLEINFKTLMNASDDQINQYLLLIIFEIENHIKNTNKEDLEFLKNCQLLDDDRNHLLDKLSKLVFAIQNLQLDNEINNEKFIQWKIEENLDTIKVNYKTIEKEKPTLTPMDYCIKNAIKGDVPTIDEIKSGMMLKESGHRKIPHITDLVMLLTSERFPELDADEVTIENLKLHFIMECPKLESYIIQNYDDFTKIINIKCDNYELPKLDYEPEPKYPFSDHSLMESIVNFVKDRKEIGVSGEVIREVFDNPQLEEIIKIILKTNVLIRFGITSIVFVHYEYRSHWLTESPISPQTPNQIQLASDNDPLKLGIYKNIKTYEKLIRLMPWTKLDGTLADESYKKWLSLIMVYCMENPDILFRDLCQQFCYIKPVDIYFLVEELSKLNCLEIMKLEKNNCDLFSKRTSISERPASILDSFDGMFIKTNNLCCLRLGAFLNNSQD